MKKNQSVFSKTLRTLSRPAFLLCMLCLMGAECPEPDPGDLLFGTEMVGKVTGTSAVVHMVTGDLCTASTKFRLHYDTVSRAHSAEYTLQTEVLSGFGEEDAVSFLLTPLDPATRYYYRVAYDTGGGWTDRGEFSLQTGRAPGESFRFDMIADMHMAPQWMYVPDGTKGNMFRNILRAGEPAPDILFTLGDEFALANQVTNPYVPLDQADRWEVLRDLRSYLERVSHSMMYIPVNGNHEGLFGWTDGSMQYASILEGKMRYFPVPVIDTFPEGGDVYGRYGAFTWGDALFVWLDVVGFNEVDPFVAKDNALYILGEEQRTFLETTLASSTATWKFIMAHHLFGGDDGWLPGYGRGNANDAFEYDQASIQTLMEEHGVQAFFYGHDHVFSVSSANGVAYICTGKAGTYCPWYLEAIEHYAPYEIFISEDMDVPSGHVEVDVTPDEATVSFVKASDDSEDGTVMATYVLTP